MKLPEKTRLLSRTIEHIDITRINVVPLVESMGRMSFSARDLSRAAEIYDRMLRDDDAGLFFAWLDRWSAPASRRCSRR